MRTSGVLLVAALAGCAALAPPQPRVVAPTDCSAWVGFDRDAELPGYLIAQRGRDPVCVPLLVTAHRPPPGYAGDYYVDEFTDARLKARWAACKAQRACFERIDAQMQRWLPPNKARATRATGTVDRAGAIDPEGEVNLADIRRPVFFAREPYREGIAAAEGRTWIVEFTVPRDTFERLDLGMRDAVRLRGWYLEGAGVDDGSGRRIRALALMAPGGGSQLTAIQHPAEKAYRIDPATHGTISIRFPNATTEVMGMRSWREILHALNEAGFDVLAYDRRGEGISGGFSDTNTLEQGEDVFRVLAELESGEGLRVLTPNGQLLAGAAAGGKLLAGRKAGDIPIVLGGNSRGSMSTAWAMTRNFAQSCSYDAPQVECSPPKGLASIKGAILIASFASGAGYLPDAPDLADRNLFLAGMAADHHIQFYPNSATLAGMPHWPAAFFAKGLWDRAESAEGTLAAYDRIHGPKEIVLARGPHSIDAWPDEDLHYLRARMVAFATAVVLGRPLAPDPARAWSDLRELVATTPDSWEPSSRPAGR